MAHRAAHIRLYQLPHRGESMLIIFIIMVYGVRGFENPTTKRAFASLDLAALGASPSWFTFFAYVIRDVHATREGRGARSRS